jgi:formate hydrogenlyase subunit 6/NADH:ubiquinone oxidoreductase subunit I
MMRTEAVREHLHALIYMLPELWRALLKRPITVRYPFGPMEFPPHFRGRVIVDEDACRGCGLCVRDCPASALELKREDKDTFHLIYHPDRCAYCGQCEVSCRFGAIKLTNEHVQAAPQRITQEVLVKPEKGDEAERAKTKSGVDEVEGGSTS